METAARVRILFEDRHILNKSHKKDGLKRSWILLKPQQETISDFASYLIHRFRLHEACTRGLVLSMDGFVLPPFLSISILKDKDIVCVKKRANTSAKLATLADGENPLELDVVENQPLVTDVQLISKENVDVETRNCESQLEEIHREYSADAFDVESIPDGDKVSKKRKISRKRQSSKRKKIKRATGEKWRVDHEIDENHVPGDENFQQHSVCLKKSLAKKDQLYELNFSLKKSGSSDDDDRCKDTSISKSMPLRVRPHQGNDGGIVDAFGSPGETEKLPSRSARRKKAKRLWLRELAKSEKNKQAQLSEKVDKELQSSEISNHKHPENHQNSDKGFSDNHQEQDEDGDVEDDVVPIVVRKGYIRFESLSKVDGGHDVQNETHLDRYMWNGMTSKKKGQKWGREKNVTCRTKDYKSFNEESPEMGKSCQNEMIELDEETLDDGHLEIDKLALASSPKVKAVEDDKIDFDKLAFLSGSPKEGDVIAYRLIELSSSWTPELSSFHVGKVSHYNPASNYIMLVPVAEYPIITDKKVDDEEFSPLSETILYGEDGSLEIVFSSLADIRIVDHANSNSAKQVPDDVVQEQVIITNLSSDEDTDVVATILENVGKKVWEEIGKALSTNNAQLTQEEKCHYKTERSGRRPLRSSTLGPTMTLLRAQNGL